MAVGAFVIWGVMPLYWHLLKSVPSLQIIMHRIVWSTVLVAGWLFWKYGRSWVRETLAIPRAAWMLALSGTLIAFNWGLYIWAVNAGHVVETSLGYFINPLLNVRSEEHTSELQSLMRISYAVFCLKKKTSKKN